MLHDACAGSLMAAEEEKINNIRLLIYRNLNIQVGKIVNLIKVVNLLVSTRRVLFLCFLGGQHALLFINTNVC